MKFVLNYILKLKLVLLVNILFGSEDCYPQWQQFNGPEGTYFTSLASIDSVVFAGTYGSGVFRIKNGEKKWMTVNKGLTRLAISNLAACNGCLYACGGRYLYKSSDLGESWEQISIKYINTDIFCMNVYGGNLYVGTYDGVYQTNDDGKTCRVLGNFKGVRCISVEDSVICVYHNYGLSISTNYGLNWKTYNLTEFSSNIDDILVFKGIIFFVYHDDNSGSDVLNMAKSINSGNTWEKTVIGSGYQTSYYKFRQKDNKIFVNTKNGLVFTSDLGNSWRADNQFKNIVWDVYLFSGNYFYYGYGNIVSSDNGSTWEEIKSGLISFGVTSISKNSKNILIGGGSLYSTINNGATINSIEQGKDLGPINTLMCFNDSIYACPQQKGVYLSINHGDGWFPINDGLEFSVLSYKDITSIAIDSNSIFIGSSIPHMYSGGGLYKSTDRGDNWINVINNLPDTVINSILLKDNFVFVSLAFGVYRSSDGGATWNKTCNGLEYTLSDGKKSSYVSVMAENDNKIFAGASNTVFVSTDNGDSWTKLDFTLTGEYIKTLIEYNSILFVGTNSNDYLNVADGGVYLSTNDGLDWHECNDGLDNKWITCLMAANGTLYAGTNGSSVYAASISDLLKPLKPLEVAALENSAICAGDTIKIGVKSINFGYPPYQYQWSPATDLITSGDSLVYASPAKSTDYRLIVKDSRNKADTVIISVKVNPIPYEPSVENDTVIEGNKATLIASVQGNYAINWYERETGGSIIFTGNKFTTPTLENSTDYYVESFDSLTSCRSRRVKVTASVILISMKAASLGDAAICENTSAFIGVKSIINGEYPFTYRWSPAAGLSSIIDSVVTASPDDTTEYRLIVTDRKGNSDTIDIIVNVIPGPEMPAIADTTVNEGESVQLNVQGPAGCVFYWYDSASGGTVLSKGNSLSINEISQSKDYWVVSEDTITGCQSIRKRVTINVIGKGLTVITIGNKEICSGGFVQVGVQSIFNGNYPYIYEWSPPAGLSSAKDSIVTASPGATTDYRLVVTDNSGKRDTVFITVIVHELPVPFANDTTAIKGDMAYLTALGPSGYNYRWYDSPTDGSLLFTGAVLNTIAIKDTNFYLESEDISTGCISKPRIKVKLTVLTLDSLSFTSLGKSFDICPGDSVEIGLSGIKGGLPPYSFIWAPVEGLDNPAEMKTKASPAKSTDYSLSISDSHNNESIFKVSININNSPASAVVSIPKLLQNPKEVVAGKSTIDIILDEGALINHQCILPDSIYCKISMDQTLYYPGENIKWHHDGGRLIMEQGAKLPQLHAGSKLMEFKGTILLGDTSETDLTIEDVRWIGGVVETSFRNGNLELTGLHEANGSKRLLKYDWTPVIFSVSPNPANSEVNIVAESWNEEPASIEIININGILIDSFSIYLKKGINEIEYKLKSGISPGIYMFSICSISGYANKLLIIE